jgi:thiamine kinase-like enzyme
VSAVAIRFDASVGEAAQRPVADLLATPEFASLALSEASTVSVLPGGASNQNFTVSDGDATWVLRLAEIAVDRFGIDRARGLAAHRAAAAAGLAPGLAAVKLPEGHCAYRYVDGVVLDPDAMRSRGLVGQVGHTLRRMHHAEAIEGRWSVFDDVRRYLGIARRERLSLPDDIDALVAALDDVEGAFRRAGVGDALCHNDLQLQNFIFDGERLWVIDWEYAGMGNLYFDLGGFSVNAELDAHEQEELLDAYFGAVRRADQARVALMTFASAMREATWAVIAKPVLTLDWDYDAWAAEYFDRGRRQRSSSRFTELLERAAAPVVGSRS